MNATWVLCPSHTQTASTSVYVWECVSWEEFHTHSQLVCVGIIKQLQLFIIHDVTSSNLSAAAGKLRLVGGHLGSNLVFMWIDCSTVHNIQAGFSSSVTEQIQTVLGQASCDGGQSNSRIDMLQIIKTPNVTKIYLTSLNILITFLRKTCQLLSKNLIMEPNLSEESSCARPTATSSNKFS